jgi:hypothetical protein
MVISGNPKIKATTKETSRPPSEKKRFMVNGLNFLESLLAI